MYLSKIQGDPTMLQKTLLCFLMALPTAHASGILMCDKYGVPACFAPSPSCAKHAPIHPCPDDGLNLRASSSLLRTTTDHQRQARRSARASAESPRKKL